MYPYVWSAIHMHVTTVAESYVLVSYSTMNMNYEYDRVHTYAPTYDTDLTSLPIAGTCLVSPQVPSSPQRQTAPSFLSMHFLLFTSPLPLRVRCPHEPAFIMQTSTHHYP